MKADILGVRHLCVFINGEGVCFYPPGFAAGLARGQRGVAKLSVDTARKLSILGLYPDTLGCVLIGDLLHFTRLGFNLI